MARAGDVVLLPFPFTDLSATKKRPVLLLSDEDGLGDFLALAVTSKAGYQASIAMTQGDLRVGTLPKPSWVRTDKLFTLNRQLVAAHFGTVTTDLLGRVRRSACKVLGCYSELQEPMLP